MALVKCKECGQKVSSKAPSCPHCGASRKRKNYGCGTLILVLVLGGMAMSYMVPTETSHTKSKDAAAPLTKEQKRIKQIEDGFSPFNGSHTQLTRYIRKTLKDPDSYEHIETVYIDEQEHLIVRTKYRAKNSFGGYVVESVTAKADINGDLIQIIK